ncbi:carboxypeptidase-like regulatory domain-containing protein [Gemmatimonas groenlandica]|uniref:Carboxypeptidase regulatory-like domain-containing protein n=1 Tax=Gemmatimonas groenlandica TaxID=2732249 RepID=A0A6M4IJL9_9BACT|nr:carboxypeptidase-like regulatory domain-containing protein [Gemmatimonas groenlandica]QJR34038.1 carboxypeptidase regulatory-like domain-containing protein [Gemmatimonas groenlandica]
MNNPIVGLLMLIGAAAIALPAAASAQQLRGAIRDSLARPLAGAEVILSSTGDRVRSDSLGRFVLAVPPRTVDTLRVRLVGYRPAEQRISTADVASALVVVLRRYPQMLDTLRARTDQDRCIRDALVGFECRRAAGRGLFRDAGQLRALRPQTWADMFDGMPGLRRVPRYGPSGYEVRVGVAPSRCLVELWNGQLPMTKSLDTPFAPDEAWSPNDVIALEMYAEYRDVPGPYRGAAWPVDSSQPCALVIYWLRGAARR